MKLGDAHIEASVRLISTEEGGRGAPMKIGFRPQLHLPGDEGDYVIGIRDLVPNPCEPGERCEMTLDVLSWDALRERIKVGTEFQIREGVRVVAEGTVTRLRAQ